MKKLLFIFISVTLLGSSAYAQVTKTGHPDWRKFSGAKKIIDNMDQSVTDGITLQDAVKDNPDIYSTKNALELATVSELETLPIAVSADYLTKLSGIIKIFSVNALPPGFELETLLAQEGVSVSIYGKSIDSKLLDVVSALVRARDKAKKELSERPLKCLMTRLGHYSFVADEDLKNLADENVMPKIEKALLFFVNQQRFQPFDVTVILGTVQNEFKDGALTVAYKMMEKHPDLKANLEPLAHLLGLKLICDDFATRNIEVLLEKANTLGVSTLSMKAVTDGASEEDFSVNNTELAKIVKPEAVAKGLENFKNITKLIEKN